MLGEANAQRVLELVYKLGDDGQELVMLFITELITAKEEILNAQETIDPIIFMSTTTSLKLP